MTALLILLVLVPWSIARQMQVDRVTTAGLIRLPLILAAIGVLGFGTGDLDGTRDTVAYLGLSAVVSIALGVWRGAVIPIWTDDTGAVVSRGNRATLALWGLLIGTKIAMGTVASVTGIFPGEHPGDIFLFIAVSFAAQNLVVARRVARPGRLLADARPARA